MLAPNPEGAAKRQRAFTLFYRVVKNEFRRYDCAEIEKDLFYRTALKIHKVTKVMPERVCFHAVL